MLSRLKRAGLATALAASAFSIAGTAEARDRYRDHDNGDDVAIAVGAGLVGLAIGAALADRHDRYYYDRDYYRHRRYVRVHDHPGYYYYYDGYPNRYYRDRYYDRYYGRYYRSKYRRDRWHDGYYHNRWNDGYRRVERWYGRDGRRYRDRDYHRDRRYHDRRWRD